MAIPDGLRHRLDLFRDTGRVFETELDIFRENSWVQVMLGQGIEPHSYHPIVDMMSDQELHRFMQFQRHKVDHVLSQLPTHREFIGRYCPASGA
jgi:tryptophan halogenase